MNALPNLVVPRDSARQQLTDRIRKGEELMNRPVSNQEQLDQASNDRRKWSSYNTELLKRLFDKDDFAAEYNRMYGTTIPVNPTLREMIVRFERSVRDSISRLEGILERLDLIPEQEYLETLTNEVAGEAVGNRVFLVHGHDDAARETVARFLERLGLEVVILHEQANRGRTIIEKLESIANVGYAVVLLTADDVGAQKEQLDNAKPRARQNVIFEMGWFCGSLGRQNVCALYQEEVEIPTDYAGVVYVPLDVAGAWRFQLARELKESGFDIDLNKAV